MGLSEGAKELGGSGTKPVSGLENVENKVGVSPTPADLQRDLIKVFGTADITGLDGKPTPIPELRAYLDQIRKQGLATLIGKIRFPLADKPYEIFV